jgi:rod shape determining protein RodA
MNHYSRFLRNFDWVLLTATLLLLGFGFAVIYSTTFSIAGGSEALQQMFFAAVGLVGLFLLASMDYRILKKFSGVLYILTIGMLVATRLLGSTKLGATRWIEIGSFQFQPSEIAKIFMVIVMAKFFAENVEQMHQPRVFAKSLVYIGIPTLLVALQPDLGTALTFAIIWGAMLLVSNIKKRYVAGVVLATVVAMPVVYEFFLKDYQQHRILNFLNPAADPTGSGWNVAQAKIAIGSGQFWGRGLGHGPQSQLNFVPFKHTDFVFAALAEEMGFVGAFAVILLFGAILYRILRIAMLSRDYFGMFIATGIFAVLFFHIFINIGMNLGIMPVTGIPLPLVSSGGTSVVITLFCIGILESIFIRYKKIDF